MKKILYFSAEWCGPCKSFGPLLQSTTSKHNIPMQKIDVDTNAELTAKHGIRTIPTMVLVDAGGNAIKKQVGVVSENTILNFYNG